MKLVPVEHLTFGKDTDLPGKPFTGSVGTGGRHEVDYWVDERLIVVTFNPRDESPVKVRFYPLDGQMHFECRAMAAIVTEYKAKQKAKEMAGTASSPVARG